MNNLNVGFARVDITPCLGIPLSGYFVDRFADGILDNLEINAVALNSGKDTVISLSVDNLGIPMSIWLDMRKVISEATGICEENLIVSSTHTHTGPEVCGNDKPVVQYRELLEKKAADAARMALDDIKPAKMGWNVAKAPNVAFVRRFVMKDGSVRTNPGIGNPDIVKPIGNADENVSLIRFDRESDSVLIVNFANHPDVVGGCKISADWPGLTRRMIEKCLPNTKCSFINGAQGDINHVNVNAANGDLNDLENDFDDVLRGYGHSRHIANVVTGAVLQAYDKVNYTDVDSIKLIEKKISVPANKAKPEELPLAHKYKELHESGKDSEIPFEAMELTTVVAEALRMVKLENAPDEFEMIMTGVRLGSVGLITIPGEGFNYIGRELKKADGYDMVVPCGISNGYEEYFPTKEAYDEGGYEARSSPFKSGVAEKIVREGTDILASLNNIQK